MIHRSWLFAPGDSPAKLAKLPQTGADAVVLDLEDAVAPQAKPQARLEVRNWLAAHRHSIVRQRPQGHWVRINSPESMLWRDDLAAIMPCAPHGLFVPKVADPAHLQPLIAEIYEHEQRAGLPVGSTKLIPMVGESARSALRIADYLTAGIPRLAGLTWGSEDLAAALGARRKRNDAGEWCDAFAHVRAQVLLTAKACKIMAIDTLDTGFQDPERFSALAGSIADDGFDGMLAIHPDQVRAINTAFAPGEDQMALARAIVGAFNASPHAATLQVGGRMVERLHLEQAQKLLGLEP